MTELKGGMLVSQCACGAKISRPRASGRLKQQCEDCQHRAELLRRQGYRRAKASKAKVNASTRSQRP